MDGNVSVGVNSKTKRLQPTIPQPAKRLSLADLKAAALARKTSVNLHNN